MRFQALCSTTRRLLIPAACAAVLGATAASCDKMPLVAPSGTALTLIAATNVLPVNGSTEITAILIEGGQSPDDDGPVTGVGTPVHNGTLVTFLTSLGRVEPAEARTEGGRAKVRLIADGRSGIATVTAYSGAATNTLEVSVGAAAAVRVVLTATPQALPAGGGTAAVTARVEDEQGNGLLGVPVSFSTTAGTLTPTAALTDGNGLATTSITTTAAATVTASAGAATAGELQITLKPRTDLTIGAPATAAVSVPAAFDFGVAGTGTAVTNAIVDWGDGTTTDLGNLSGTRRVTHLFSRSGALRVTLTATDGEGVRNSVGTEMVVNALSMTVAVAPANPTFGTAVTFTATVLPAGASIDRYEWDFDGDLKVTQGPQTSYSFPSRGTKNVTVRAIPTRGPTVTTVLQIEVN